MTKAETIDKAIELCYKKIELLKELKASILTEEADYIAHQVKVSRGISDDYNHYFLIEKSTMAIKAEGTQNQINKYLERRKISKVYWRMINL